MHRSLRRRLSGVAPFVVSGAIHLALLVAVLVVGARLVPRIEAVIHAELVALETEVPHSKPEVTPPRPRPQVPLPKKPLVPPRLVEARMSPVEPPAHVEERPPVPVEPPSTKVQTAPEPPRSDITKVDPPPAEPRMPTPEPPRASAGGPTPDPARASSAGGGAPSNTKSPESLPSGVSMLALERPSGDGGAGGGRGGGSGTGVASSSGNSGHGITRTAIPRGGYQVHPRYPVTARRLGIQGTTLLRVFVSIDGRVTNVEVERTAGHGDLDDAAADAVRRWRFEPARRGDEPVAMWVLLPVEFRLK